GREEQRRPLLSRDRARAEEGSRRCRRGARRRVRHEPTREPEDCAVIAPGQIFVIGDSHIGLGDSSEGPIVAWLDRLEALAPRALYLNGDLFHYLIADDKFCTRSVELVFDRLRKLRDAGVPVHYVEGNRDFFLEGSFAEEAVTDVAMEYAVRAGARNYLI